MAIDELPVFRASFEIITTALAQVRKFLCRFIVAFQGTQLFEERTEDRLLNALIGQCNVQFFFRHKNPVDAKFFGEIIKLPSIETKKVKHVLTQKQQYQEGHDLITLTDTSESFSDAEQDGGSTANAVSDTETTTQGTTQSSGTNDSTTRVAEAVRNVHSDQSGHSQQSGTSTSQASARGTTQTKGNNWSRTKTRGASVTRKQTLVPRILTREVVTAIQFYTTDEQIVEAASELTRLIRGSCFLYIAGQGVLRVQIPESRDPLAGLPRFVAKKLTELRQQVLARPEFDTPANLQQKRIEFERKLIEFLSSVPRPAVRNVAEEEAPLLIVPENTDN